MRFSISSPLILLATAAAAKKCINVTVPVDLAARQPVFDIEVPQTNLDVQDFIANMTQQGRNFTDIVLTGYNTTTGRYNISAQYCVPSKSNSRNPTVQVLTHGIGVDRTYWDLPFNNFNYSYINVATDEFGFSTVSFDRLGVSESSHGEPLNEIQAFLEVAATAQLTMMLRNGTFPGVNHKFEKVVHVGHSFGSVQTYLLANMYPKITDGIILTGFSMTLSFAGLFLAGGNFQQANLNQPLRFGNVTGVELQNILSTYLGPLLDVSPINISSLSEPQDLPNGYIIPSNTEANKYLFFKPKHYDPAMLTFAEQTKQPATVGEFLTLGSAPATNEYSGPVMVINGGISPISFPSFSVSTRKPSNNADIDADLPFCGGDCLTTGQKGVSSIPAMVKTNFPKVADHDFVPYVQPNTAHGNNFHYNATAGYRVMQNFFHSKNLGSS
ncbi:hypothetical protein B7463_g541, partial [Scytalidium lignicola]